MTADALPSSFMSLNRHYFVSYLCEKSSKFFLNHEPTVYLSSSEKMEEIEDNSIDLIITSPPYGQIKDYNSANQIGFGENFTDYFSRLNQVWRECYRILAPHRRCCINIGDQYLRARDYKRYRVLPIAGKIIQDCLELGFDFMGDIIWKKVSTTNTTGGCSLMGSLFYPSNGMITFDYEHILIFKKFKGKPKKMSRETKELSKICMDEWKRWYVGHWVFPGIQQKEHIAMFPDELPYRLIRMFSHLNDTVLDPFVGSGTTLKVARNYGRKSIGYEINEDFMPIIKEKIQESYSQRDYHSIIHALHKNEVIFDYNFSTQKSILCVKNEQMPKSETTIIDFLKVPDEYLQEELQTLYFNKLEENNIKHYVSRTNEWEQIRNYIIIVDHLHDDISYSEEKDGKIVNFIPYNDFMKKYLPRD